MATNFVLNLCLEYLFFIKVCLCVAYKYRILNYLRKAEKERLKARKKACRERGETLGPTRKQLARNKMSNSSCQIKVAIDCGFDDIMADKVFFLSIFFFLFEVNRTKCSQLYSR